MLQVNEIFLSVSGEVGLFRQGEWVVFVRLAGCNLRCAWCDTVRAQEPIGTAMNVNDIINRVSTYGVKRVVLTGGEPFIHLDTPELVLGLVEKEYSVQIETNGTIGVDRGLRGLYEDAICVVMDFKLPSSQMTCHMNVQHWKTLEQGDWLKFVIANRTDYEFAKRLILNSEDICPARLAFSACPPLSHALLYSWMKVDNLTHVVQSMQIHKLAALDENLDATVLIRI